MEDYKKKYEDALKKAKENKPLEEISPELKESEDERIRKSLIDVISEWSEDTGFGRYNVPRNEVIAWLEKQGESRVNMVQWKSDNLMEVLEFTGKNKNFDKWFTSFEEFEKYVHEHNDIFKIFNEDGSHYEVPVGAWIVKTPDGYNVPSKAKYKQKIEQKPAWSEEDKNMFKWVIRYLNNKMLNASITEERTACKNAIDWLEKQGKQKSVDKEYTFKAIPRLLDMMKPTEKAKAYCQILIDTLKKEGYHTDAKIVGECLKQMNGEKVAMAVMDGQPITDKVEPKFKVGDKVNRNDRKDEEYYILTIASVNIDEHCYTCHQGSVIDFEKQDLWHIVEQKPADKQEMSDEEYCSLCMDINCDGCPYANKVEPKFKAGDFIADGRRVLLVLANKEERNLGETYSTYCEGLVLDVYGNVLVDGKDFSGFRLATDIERANFVHDLKVGTKINYNPAWSEEDEKMLNDVIGAISAADYYTYDDKQEIENWLKSLKHRYLLQLNPISMIQWRGDNLKEVIDFTGKSPNFDKWFKNWDEYENYVRTHGNIFKLFNQDGSHYEVPVGAWIVRTPDGYNVPSQSKFVQKSIDNINQEMSDKDYCNLCMDINCDGCPYVDKLKIKDNSVEWSNDDENVLLTIIDDIKGKTPMSKAYKIKALNWLQSLKPQSHWKPSEEQLKALKYACNEHWEPDGLDPLYTLYQDLKKLKG